MGPAHSGRPAPPGGSARPAPPASARTIALGALPFEGSPSSRPPGSVPPWFRRGGRASQPHLLSRSVTSYSVAVRVPAGAPIVRPIIRPGAVRLDRATAIGSRRNARRCELVSRDPSGRPPFDRAASLGREDEAGRRVLECFPDGQSAACPPGDRTRLTGAVAAGSYAANGTAVRASEGAQWPASCRRGRSLRRAY